MGIFEWAVVAVIVGIVVALVFGFPFFAVWLSGGDSFFTRVEERAVKAIMRGGSDGDLSHFIMSRSGQHLNAPGMRHYDPSIPAWEILPHDATRDSEYETRPWLFRKLGIHWLGIPGLVTVYSYRFQWNDRRQDKATGENKIHPRDEVTSIAVVADYTYAFTLREAETADNLPVDIEFDLVVRITNPFKALFEVDEWLKAVSAAVQRSARSYVGSREFGELVSERARKRKGKVSASDHDTAEEAKRDSFSKPILEFNFHHPDDAPFPEGIDPNVTDRATLQRLAWQDRRGLFGRYGIEIVSVNPISIALAGKNADEFQRVTVELYTAEQRGEAVKIAADADAHATTVRGMAEAGVIKAKGTAEGAAITARMQAWAAAGELAPIIAQTEAMASQGPGKTVIWANNPFVGGAAQSVAEALKAATGGKE